MHINALLSLAVEKKASDLHLKVPHPPVLRILGDLVTQKDLPKLAADAKKYGVTTCEILGWDIGGIDRGYPQYRPDPRLGTPEEFRQALAEVKKIGVHPLIFANIQVADTATPLFNQQLYRYVLTGTCAPDFSAFGRLKI